MVVDVFSLLMFIDIHFKFGYPTLAASRRNGIVACNLLQEHPLGGSLWEFGRIWAWPRWKHQPSGFTACLLADQLFAGFCLPSLGLGVKAGPWIRRGPDDKDQRTLGILSGPLFHHG